MEKIRVYVGCSLTHVGELYQAEIEMLRSLLKRNQNVEVSEFFGLGGSDADSDKVYEQDIYRCVLRCDLMIAECSLPSTGLGVEIGMMIQRRRPIWMFAHDKARVSRLLIGAACSPRHDFIRFDRYQEGKLIDILPEIESRIEETLRSHESHMIMMKDRGAWMMEDRQQKTKGGSHVADKMHLGPTGRV